ncbi:hypothetical protein GPL21_06185 [Bradyrhizobium pachyrhizi]|uniref:Transcriptional regulator n=1 Tax=Bradyrhizobium pachyrhizi TaxID=280333 RepID=A0A844SNW8_9BRAD|nr:hypothetical protein [Bradyrhizobium pachyrhizi]MVT64701.1 hypothetical protein [Bradyrhizobium pachyrhizi]
MKPTLEELQALRLLRAFSSIQDADNRKTVVDFVEAIAKAEREKKKGP